MHNKHIIFSFLGFLAFAMALSSFSNSRKADKGIIFFEGNFTAAKAKAKAENKLIFMDAYASWCGPCKRMSANVFTDEKVGAFFNTKFVNLKVDMEKGEGVALSKLYQVEFYPTLFFMDANGKVIKKVVGYQDIESLIKEGQSVK